MRLLLLTALLALLGWEQVAGENYCFHKDSERLQTHQFGAKTAYQKVKGKHADEYYQMPNCEPKKIWIFHRHGTRQPDADYIKSATKLETLRDLIVQNYNETNTNALCQVDLNTLKDWKWNTSITVDMDEHLTYQGFEDLRESAKFYQHLYPTVLPNKYNSSYYHFRHTDTQRTRMSFRGFTEGLFGKDNLATASFVSEEKDLLLKPYKRCKEYFKKNFKKEGSEYYKLRSSDLWNKTVSDIARRLGIGELSNNDIKRMFDMCRYEQAWHLDRPSPWCAAFLPEHVTVMEYAEDLLYYYGSGYGFECHSRLNCRVVQDMLNRLNNTVSPHAVAYFAHSPGLQMLLDSLEINKDAVPLRADNFDSMKNRKWRNSLMTPFAANLVAVKYECPAYVEKEKVKFFLNQNVVPFDWCYDGLCNWSDVLKKYKTFAEVNCDEYYCRSGAIAGQASFLATALMAAFVYLIHY